MSDDLLANVERPRGDKPEPRRDEPAPPGYWHGSARSHVEHWRDRALEAETKLAALRALLTGERWRPHT
jgi:hypothetical protein